MRGLGGVWEYLFGCGRRGFEKRGLKGGPLADRRAELFRFLEGRGSDKDGTSSSPNTIGY